MKRLLISTLLLLTVRAFAAEADAPSTAWLKQHAIPFATVEAGRGFDDLQPLKDLVGKARIVSLGEPTHGSREVFQLKHRLLEFLVAEMGFSIFAIEANLPEAFALNEYVIEGRGNPRALIGGMYFWTWNTKEVLAMVEWMRAWNRDHPDRKPLQFTGFDMQTPDVAARIAADFAARHAPDLAGPLRETADALQRVIGLKTGSSGANFGSATGTFPVEAARGKKVTLSAWIRTEDVRGMAGAWWRCDTPSGVRGFNNMSDRQIAGTRNWERHEFTVEVPPDTRNINFGFLLLGEGAAWFDDVEITIDGQRFEDPSRFSFDFENGAVRFLSDAGKGFVSQRVATTPHGGEFCLEVRSVKSTPPEPSAVAQRARELADALRQRVAALPAEVPAKEREWAVQNAVVLAQCAAMHAAPNSFEARDEAMAANVNWILAQNPGERIVLWAHNGHVGRKLLQIRCMGSELAKTHGADMVVFGFLTGTGTYTAMAGSPPRLKTDNALIPPPEGSVESLFTQSGLPRAFLDLRSPTAKEPGGQWTQSAILMRSVGAIASLWQYGPAIPGEVFDVLVWVEQTSASRPLAAP